MDDLNPADDLNPLALLVLPSEDLHRYLDTAIVAVDHALEGRASEGYDHLLHEVQRACLSALFCPTYTALEVARQYRGALSGYAGRYGKWGPE
jgi:hypothetical protein